MKHHDPRALATAQAVSRRENPEFAILFGSRARGDYDDHESDIDIMLVANKKPFRTDMDAAVDAAADALRIYGREVPVQLLRRTPAEFHEQRQTPSTIESIAAKQGIIIPGSRFPSGLQQENPAAAERQAQECQWLLQDARHYLKIFEVTDQPGQIVAARHATAPGSALVTAMQALLAAHGISCAKPRRLQRLCQIVNRTDPELGDFKLSIPPEAYEGYQPGLTAFPDYHERTVNDVQCIMNRAQRIMGDPPPSA